MVQNMQKSINIIQHINRIKDKSHIIGAEKAFDKIQYSFMTKGLKKLGIEGTYLNIIKSVYHNSIANIILNKEQMKLFPLKSRIRQSCPSLSLPFNIVLEFLVKAMRQGKNDKRDSNREGKSQIVPTCR
jgi:hypothetical protein